MKLLRVLHVQVPHVDPSLFLDRFAAQLNFGDRAQQIAQTAVRLVQVQTPLLHTSALILLLLLLLPVVVLLLRLLRLQARTKVAVQLRV